MRRKSAGRSLTLKRFAKSPGGLGGLALVALLFGAALFAPWISPYPPLQMDREAIYASPGAKHLLGADELGRDILSRLLFGSRIVILVCFSATAVASVLGIGLGLIAAYCGGRVDNLAMRFADVLLAFPAFLLAIAFLLADTSRWITGTTLVVDGGYTAH